MDATVSDSHTMKLYLAIEGGGTTTRAALYDARRVELAHTDGAASNPIDVGLHACVAIIASLGRQVLADQEGVLCVVAAGVAGAAHPTLREAIARGIRSELGVDAAYVTDDLRPLLMANAPQAPALLAIAGTGSSVLAKSAEGEMILIGGRGPLFCR